MKNGRGSRWLEEKYIKAVEQKLLSELNFFYHSVALMSAVNSFAPEASKAPGQKRDFKIQA